MGYGVDWINTHWGDTGPDKYDTVPHHLVGLFGGIELQYQDIATLLIEYDTSQINTGIRLFFFDRGMHYQDFPILYSFLLACQGLIFQWKGHYPPLKFQI
jgi:hypothetical protein